MLLEVDVARTIIALATLGYASYMDLKTREITPWLWIIASLIALPFTAYEAWFLVSKGYATFCILEIALSAMALPFIVYMYRKGLFGGADMLAYVFLMVDMPWYPIAFGLRSIIPIPLLTLFYASLVVGITVPFKMLKNLTSKKFREHARELNLKGIDLIKFSATASAMTVKEYLKKRFWFPLEILREEGDLVKRELRSHFNVEEEYEDHQKAIRELVNKGKVREEDIIFVTYGVPFVVFMFAGFIVSLVVGDYPIRFLIMW